jgi:hypothetical protein
MTLLALCQEVSGRLGLETLSSVASSTNQTARRLFRLSNASGRALARRADWQVMRKEHTFLTVAQYEQTNGDLPDDFDRYVQETGFNRTSTRPLAGPLTPQEWQQTQSLTANIAPTDSIYIRGNVIYITPAPAAGETVAFEYMSKYWVETAASTTGADATSFANDTDETVLDEEMITLDILWRYTQSRGLPYAEDFRSAELMIADRISRDGIGKRRMQMIKTRFGNRPIPPVVPEGSWVP